MTMRKIALKLNTLALIILGVFVNSAPSIECYICDSTRNPACTDLSSRIKSENCTLDNFDLETWAGQLGELDFNGSFEPFRTFGLSMQCQKVVGKLDNGELVTVRNCQFTLQHNEEICEITQENAKKMSIELVQCLVCDTDKCNGASIQHMGSVLSVLLISFMKFVL